MSRAGRHPDLPAVALGTDTVNASNHHDLLRAAATAADLYGEVRGDRGVLPATRVLEWATLGGARALGLDDPIGSLAVGRRADLPVFDAGPLIRNAANALVHGAPRAVHAIVDGVPLLVDGVVDVKDEIVAEAGPLRSGSPGAPGSPRRPAGRSAPDRPASRAGLSRPPRAGGRGGAPARRPPPTGTGARGGSPTPAR